jgi:hypothetical protein
LVEARHGGDGQPKLLAVLDIDRAALGAEAARLSVAAGTIAVEVIDRATWEAMRRLALTGMVQFTHDSRVLHRATALGDEATGMVAPHRSAADLLAEAGRALRMAKVLAAGGFPEEVPALLGKALGKAAAAWLAEHNELPAGTSAAADGEIRRLVEAKQLPAEALVLLDAMQSSAGCPEGGALERLFSAAERVLAAGDENVVKAAA